MNSVLKGMLLMLLIIYVISPVDFFPGPVDDALLGLLYFASNKKGTKSKDEYYYKEVEYDQ